MNQTTNDFLSGEKEPVKKLELLFRELYPPLFVYAIRILGNRSVAEDIVQDHFTKIAAGMPPWESYAHARAASYIAVRNRCIDWWRGQGKEEECPEGPEQENTDVFYDPLRKMVRLETHELVRKAVDELPGARREVLRLFYFEDMTLEQIALHLGKDRNATKALKHYALKQLRRILQDKYRFSPYLLLLLCWYLQNMKDPWKD